MVKITKKYKENFAEESSTLDKVIDDILSYFPFYFTAVINFFRYFINKTLSGDLFYLVYLFCIFVFIKMYIRGKVIPVQELYFESVY